MPSLRNIGLEFWHHKEKVAGKKGQQYIFRNKWLMLIQAISALSIIPLFLSAFLFYKANETEIMKDLLQETAILSKGAAINVEIFLNQYVSMLRVISSGYSFDELTNKDVIESLVHRIEKAKTGFSGVNLMDDKGKIIFEFGNKILASQNAFLNISRHDQNQDSFIYYAAANNRETQLLVSIKLTRSDGKILFLSGLVDTRVMDIFLAKLKLKDIIDIYILDKKGILLTPSTYFGIPGKEAILPQPSVLSTSGVLDNNNNKGDGDFLFFGITHISNTEMRLGIILSNHSFNLFMTRIKSHIVRMVSLSALFVVIVVLLLVTYLVQALYRTDMVRQVYLAKVARSSKMASVGQLAAGVAHEINNPLAIINEKAGLLEDHFTFRETYKKDDRLLPVVESIIDAVQRAGTITHRLLGFARETDSKIQSIDVSRTVQEVLDFVKKEAEYKSIGINVNIIQPIPEITTDNGKLQQILINLVNNAIAALDENGKLTIGVKNNILTKNIEIYVQDNGCGIPEENQRKIFEPFFTTKAKTGGTGLGLSVTYGLIKDLQGKLEMKSKTGEGTIFTIVLPYENQDKE